MYKRNSGSAEVDILQNQFTAYLTKAFHNGRAQYLLKKNRLEREIATEDLQLFFEPHFEDFTDYDALYKALKTIKERELYVLLARVIEEKGFREIAEEINMSYKATTEIYYRTIAKLRKLLGGDTDEF